MITSSLKYLFCNILRTSHFCLLFLLLGFSFSAHAQVNLVVPATSTNGVVTITWSGAGSISTLYEYGGASPDIQRATGTTAGTGSYSDTRLPGTYYFYLRSCVPVSQAPPSCTNTLQKSIVVTTSQQSGNCGAFTANSSVVVVAPNTSSNGSFSITWSGASTPTANTTVSSILYECAGPSIPASQRASSTAPTGSYSTTGKVPGNYYYYVEDCVFPYQAAPICKKTAKKIIAVTLPSTINTTGESYEYDALGRLNSVKVEGAAKSNYEYDNAGNRKSVTEP